MILPEPGWTQADHDMLIKIDADLESMKTYIESRFKSIEGNTETASRAMDKRLDQMNEFRGQIKDQTATMMPRSEFDIQHSKICDDVKDLRESRATLAGKADQSSVNIGYAISIIALAMAIGSAIAGILGV